MGNNLDVNSGNPIGMGMGAACLYKGARTTAYAYLEGVSTNLEIVTDAPIAKIILDDKTAKGVRTIDGRDFLASKEVIISSGALNSPQILMLSGIGNKTELSKHNIELLHELPHVGKNLQDHCFAPVTIIQKPGTNERAAFHSDEKAMEAAKAQHAKDGTGPLSTLYSSTPMGWFKSEEALQSQEFKDLPQEIQTQISKPTVPTFEIATVR